VEGHQRAVAATYAAPGAHPDRSLLNVSVMVADAAAVVTAPGCANQRPQGASLDDKASRAAAYKRAGLQKLRMLPDDVRQCIMAAARMYCNAVLDAGGTLPGMSTAAHPHHQHQRQGARELAHAPSHPLSMSAGSGAAAGKDGSDQAVQPPVSAAAM
jgi:hypothetical protein